MVTDLIEHTDVVRAHAAAAAVLDPEVPVLTIAELGVLRRVYADQGEIVAEVSPTYLGCPAVLAIEVAVEVALRDAGFKRVRVVRVMAPAWSTDDMTDVGRAKLKAYGIAPPAKRSGKGALLFATETVACPKCNSEATERVSEFGSTACKALWRCTSCREPFDYFKCM
jgi:ring-1,2-phenylacetyl-CoA epoxidase subunit PaaD